ncbi:MAG: ABC transporter substrate-binding protein [Tepidiformaceae bacterium]
MKRFLLLLPALLLALVFVAACGGDDDNAPDATSAVGTGPTTAPSAIPAGTPAGNVTLRLGYFPNLTHSQPLVGLERGTYAEELGANVKIETKTFNAGPAVIEAIFAGEIDISYIGPNPAINGYVQSDGEAIRIIAGATSGGALFIVRPGANIDGPEDLEGKTIATPQLGNTQDVALRAYLADEGYEIDEFGGDVNVKPTANPDALTLFRQGNIDGAWVPEPWGTRLIQEAGGELFLDERDRWPEGAFVTTHVIVRTGFLEDHPDVVRAFLLAHVKTTEWINDNPEEAREFVNAAIEEITTAPLPDAVLDAAWENLDITYDPIPASLFKSAKDAFDLGLLEVDDEPDLSGIYDLTLLNQVLEELKLDKVE